MKESKKLFFLDRLGVDRILHKSVLLEPVLTFFKEQRLHSFLDATLGGAGHAEALLQMHPEIELFYGMDQDASALERAPERLAAFTSRLRLIQSNFRYLNRWIPSESIDGILLDIGLSSIQLDAACRGFSLYQEGPLDMRMDLRQELTAAEIVNSFSEKQLGELFLNYGEEPRWRAAAKAIVARRKKKSFTRTVELAEALYPVLTRRGGRGNKLHPATLIFQALRIYVNDELTALKEGVIHAIGALKQGGRLGVICFHSLEDRIVKHTFKQAAIEKKVLLLTKHPIQATRAEILSNRRSRSAKLRFLQKI